jgi:hypothetical protein
MPYSRLESGIATLVPRRSAHVLCDEADGVAERAVKRLAAIGYSDVYMGKTQHQTKPDVVVAIVGIVNVAISTARVVSICSTSTNPSHLGVCAAEEKLKQRKIFGLSESLRIAFRK